VAGSFARFLGLGSYTVTVNNSESMAGLVEVPAQATATLTINAAGSGGLDVVANTTLTTGLPAQGFYVSTNKTVVINAPITGSGGINLGLFTTLGTPCTIYLNGNNTYSGGTVLQSSSYLV
jgi:hypothetical protein